MRLHLIVRSPFLLFCCLIGYSAFAQSLLVVSQTEVWKIDPAGSIDRLDYDFGGPVLQASSQGTTGPVVSPDQKRIAFTKGNDLCVLDLATMRSAQATKVGRPYTTQFASVFVLISSWSADSRKILYHVEKGETQEPDSTGPARKLRKAPYGDHLYDLETKNSRPTFLPGEFLTWLPDGDFLVKRGELENAQLMRVHPGDKNGQLIVVKPGDYGQMQVKPGGQQIIARRGKEIVLLDLADGKTSTLAEGTRIEYQSPAFSPSGDHFSYLREYPLSTPGWYGRELLVDGATVYRSDRDFYCKWIDDETLALLVFERNPTKKPTWILVDRKTGRGKLSKPVT